MTSVRLKNSATVQNGEQHRVYIKGILGGYLHGINVLECWQTSELFRSGFKLIKRKRFWGRDLLFCVCISHGMSNLASKSKFSILF